MSVVYLAFKNFIAKKLNNSLAISLMALGVALILLILTLKAQLEQQFGNNVKGIDMVIGAKGSPLQLILSSIYQIDAPTGNINMAEANQVTKNPFIKKAIPIAMGDSYMGYRIVGCTEKYWSHYEAKLAAGKFPMAALECTVGHTIAQKLNLKLGDTFASTHGLDQEGTGHEDQKYTVVGILQANNTVLNQLIITPLESVWAVHEHGDAGAEALKMLEEDHDHEAEDHDHEAEAHNNEEESKEITAMLVQFRNPMGLMMLPRSINANTKMQAALPSIEINRLFSMLGIGIDTLSWVAYIVLLTSAISVFITLYQSLKERKYEIALMLSMGASRAKIFLMLLFEGLFVGFLGFCFGVVLSKIGLYLLSKTATDTYKYSFDIWGVDLNYVWVALVSLAICIIAAATPAVAVYKIKLSETLAEQ